MAAALRLAGRLPLAVIAGCGVGEALLLIVQAVLLGDAVQSAFLGHAAWTALLVPSALLVGAFAFRGVLGWVSELAGARAAAGAKASVRGAAAARLPWLGTDTERTGEVAVTLVDGLEALDGYCTRYLPQLAIAVAAPLAIIAWVLYSDPLSALVLALTAPLVPAFMILVGLVARERTSRRWRAMTILSAHFLDVVQGLVTLRIFDRSRAQEETVGAIADQHRRETMAALRTAFLSSLVLELIAAVSTALVAVEIGMRLLGGGGGLQLATGLAILVLAPEVYLPLRRLGAEYHASRDALDPLARAMALLDAGPVHGSHVPDLRRDEILFAQAGAIHPGRPPVLRDVSLRIAPGEKVAVVGESGAGKTTLLGLLLFEDPSSGSVTIGGVDRRQVRSEALYAQTGWLPQRPGLFAGTVADSIRIGTPAAADDDVRVAADAAGLALPLGRPVGERGGLLSAGERQRVALARALLGSPALLVLDEPGANLEVAARRRLARQLAGLRSTVVMATHDDAMAGACDRVVRIVDGALVEEPRAFSEQTRAMEPAV